MNRTIVTAALGVLTGFAAQAQQTPAAIPLDKFAQLPAMRDAELSPDGTRLAYFRPVNGRSHLVIQTLIGSESKPILVPPVDDLDFDWLHWANNDRVVFTVFAMRTRQITETTETRLWAINRDGSNALHIVKPATVRRGGSHVLDELPHAQLQGNVIHWLPHEPNHILLALDADDTRGDEIRRIDIRSGEYDIVQNDITGIQHWFADRSGDIRLAVGYRNKRFNMMIRDDEDKWISADKRPWWDEDLTPLGFAESPDVALFAGPGKNGFDVIRKIDIRTGEELPEIFEADGADVSRIVDDPVTQLPAGYRYTIHQDVIEYFDDGMAALQRAIDAALPGSVNEIVSMTEDRQMVLVHSSSDVDPGSYMFLDREHGRMSFVADRMPGLPKELLSPVRPVSYEARDGLTIPAYLTSPKDTPRKNLPTVILPHGGPASRDDRSFWFLSQFLVSRGYAVFQPNFRGSSGYGRAFRDAGKREWGGKMQEDVTDGARWLVEEGIADPDRMCIVGWSYGGYAAAMGVVQTPDLYQCAASINGVLNLPRLIADDRRYVGGSAWIEDIGLEGERAAAVSPYHRAEDITVPLLIIQAQDDSRVHEDQGRGMADRLRGLGKLYEYVEVELGGHSMTNEAARRTILSSLESFLAEHLRD